MAFPPEKQDSRLMREMFGAIAPRYDLITRMFSYGMDGRWKRIGVDRAGLPDNARVLDLACGTGDFSKLVATARPGAVAVAADLTHNMLRLARETGVDQAVCADAMRLPFPDGSFDAVFVGYGLRNFPNLGAAVREIERVTRPGGLLVSLDFFLPRNPVFRPLYLGYLWAQGALWGLLLHGRARTYTYIPDSLRSFVSMDEFSSLLQRTGYASVRQKGFILGGIGLHWAAKS
jgi:demethylmenaquinone methyltransferase/2-methoxy-6-polyprenyl-1,4-benzoquinol methylase